MNFIELDNHILEMNNFILRWRFNKIDKLQLREIFPFNKFASEYLSDFISNAKLHEQIPFSANFFKTLENIRIEENNNEEIKQWLSSRKLSLQKTVYLSWDNETAIKTNWNTVINLWNSFFYSSSDDLTIFDESLEWSILFFHENTIYWGINRN